MHVSVDDSIDISVFEKIGSIRSSLTYRSYPKIYQRNLIPDDVLINLNERWSDECYLAPPVNFYLLKDVYVLSEGLVFTTSGAWIVQTATGHSKQEVVSAENDLALTIARSSDVRSVPKGVLCKKRGASNYGHWVVEMLPKAFLVKTVLGVADWPIIVHETGRQMHSIVQESIEAVGLSMHQIISINSEATHFDQLIVVDGLTSHSVFMSPVVLECMEHIAGSAPKGTHDSVYARRAPSVTRDFENESEVAELFRNNGYTSIVTNDLSFLGQVGVFKTAKRVVGPMGAALTNSIFCRPGTEVVVFSPASAKELFFWHIAESKKLDYYEVRCEEVGAQKGPLPWDRSLRISLKDVGTVLLKIKSRREDAVIEFGNTKQVSPPGSLTDASLINKKWYWRTSSDQNSAITLQFSETGSLDGYQSDNETKWRLVNGYLEIYNKDGLCSWMFDDAFSKNAKIKIRGRFVLHAWPRAIALIEEI